MTPSGDRTANVEVNGAVFSMANIVPQAGRANQRGWNDLENWTRARVREGSEAVVYAGTHGSLGEMSGKPINLPAYTWKVVVVYKNISRSPGAGEVPEPLIMAAVFENESSGPPILMDEAQTTVDEIEELIGVDLLAGLPDEMERRLESKLAHWSFP
jgi:endonuclease G